MAENNTIKPKPSPKQRSQNHTLQKRAAKQINQGENVIHVGNQTSLKCLVERCNKLISQNKSEEILIYCLGAAISKGILLALNVCENNLSYDYATKTYSTELIDDLEPTGDDFDYEIQRRTNSALEIRVFKKDLLSKVD